MEVARSLGGPPTPNQPLIYQTLSKWGGGGGGFGGFALTIWAIDDARAVGDDEYKTGNDEG